MVKKYLLAVVAGALLVTLTLTANSEPIQPIKQVGSSASNSSTAIPPTLAASATVDLPPPLFAASSALAASPKPVASTSVASTNSNQAGLGIASILVIAILSFYGTYLSLRGLAQTRSMGELQEDAAQTLLNAPVIRDAAESLTPNSPYRLITEDALESFHKHTLVHSQIPLDRWLSLSLSIAKPKIFPNTQVSTSVINALANAALLIGVLGFIGELMFAFMGTAKNTSTNLLAYIGATTMVPVLGLIVWKVLRLLIDKIEARNIANRQRFDSYCRELIAVFLRVAHKIQYGVAYHTMIFGTTRGGMSMLNEPETNALDNNPPQIVQPNSEGAMA